MNSTELIMSISQFLECETRTSLVKSEFFKGDIVLCGVYHNPTTHRWNVQALNETHVESYASRTHALRSIHHLLHNKLWNVQ